MNSFFILCIPLCYTTTLDDLSFEHELSLNTMCESFSQVYSISVSETDVYVIATFKMIGKLTRKKIIFMIT